MIVPPFLYDDLYDTYNQLLINSLIASDDGQAKSYLAVNENLNMEQVASLAADSDPEVRTWVAKRKSLPESVLVSLLGDKVECVKATSLSNYQSDPELFRKTVLEGRFSAGSRNVFMGSFHAVGNIDVFTRLWETAAGGQSALVYLLEEAVENDLLSIDVRVISFVHQQILLGEASKSVREAYAECVLLAVPAVLDSLKEDSHRPVLDALASNGDVWPSTHEFIIDHYKTPHLRMMIARQTKDNGLLNKIYAGTRSKSIRDEVLKNPVFILLP